MGLTQKLGTIPLAIQTDSSNNVGIGGAANASYKLAVTGASLFSSNILANGVMSLGDDGTYGATYKTLGLTGNTDGTHRILAGTSDDMYIAAATSRGIKFCVNGSITTRAIITSNGNVGIGTSSPNDLLEVRGGFIRLSATAGNGPQFNIYSNGQTNNHVTLAQGFALATDNIAYLYNRANADFVFGVNNTQKFRLFANGRATFNGGSTDRGYQLQVMGDTSSYAMEIRQNNNAANYDALTITHEATSGSRRMLVFNSGGYGTVGTITSGDTWTSYNTSSDYRLKEDLKEVKGLQKISAIKVYDFKWKINDTRTDGVLAHELAEILPYAVYGDKDGVDEDGKPIMQGVDYSKIVPVLVKAIQELNAKVTALENK